MGSPSRPSGDIYRRYGPTCLRVSYLPDDCRAKDLRRLFEKFGPIKNIYMPRNNHGREPSGFGFVHFVDPYDAAKAKDQTNGRFLLGIWLSVKFAEEDRGDTRSREHRGESSDRRRSPPGHYSPPPGDARSRFCRRLDRLSLLPLDLRDNMLSLLPTIDAVRTCVLSSEWEHSWKHRGIIRLDDEQVPVDDMRRIYVYQNQIMEALGPIPLKKFYLHITKKIFAPMEWIREDVFHHVIELELLVHSLELPEAFFTSETLAKLRLRVSWWVCEDYDNPSWEPNLRIHLPRLVSLDSSAGKDVAVNVFRLIEGSPRLESLTLSGLREIPSASHVGKYLNLKALKLIDGLKFDAVFCLLKRCPNLVNRHVSKLDRLPRMTRESTPQCMLDTLKAVKITDCGGPDSPEFLFAKYVLKHSVYLKKLIISCGPTMQEDTENLLRSELVEHARADGCKVYLSTRYAFEEC